MDYRTLVNPTYLTAKSTLFMLAGAGNEDAKKVKKEKGGQLVNASSGFSDTMNLWDSKAEKRSGCEKKKTGERSFQEG